jgi:hypothetical protein
VTPIERIRHAAHRLLTDPELAPLVQHWELSLLNAVLPAGPVDPLRLAMNQGDRERLVNMKALAAEHEKSRK